MNRTSQGKWFSLAIVIACGATGLVACASSDAPTEINPQPLPPGPIEAPGRQDPNDGTNNDGTNKEGLSSSGGGGGTSASSPDADAGPDGSKDQ